MSDVYGNSSKVMVHAAMVTQLVINRPYELQRNVIRGRNLLPKPVCGQTYCTASPIALENKNLKF